jgi:hypothetical protein
MPSGRQRGDRSFQLLYLGAHDELLPLDDRQEGGHYLIPNGGKLGPKIQKRDAQTALQL